MNEKVSLKERKQRLVRDAVYESALRLFWKQGYEATSVQQIADACVVIPTVNAENITPHTEGFQALVWHLLVSQPRLKASQTKWESMR